MKYWALPALALIALALKQNKGSEMGQETRRGIRNNNPGNIERNGTQWQGMAADQSGDDRFIVFSDPVFGIRAMARTLGNYQRLHGIDSVYGVINRWAPVDDDNDTVSYAAHVADQLAVSEFDSLNLQHYMPELIAAIIKHENGVQPYSMTTIKHGISLA